MVTFFLVVLGGLMGAAADEANGAFIGMIIGYLAARTIVDRTRRKTLDDRLAALELQVALLQGGARPREVASPIVTPAPVTPAVIEAPRDEGRAPPAEDRSPMADGREPIAPLFPATPAGPDPLARLKSLLFGGNTVVRVGVIILLFGVGFLVKYGAEHGMFPIELRLIGAVILGMALLVVGFRLRAKRLAYAVSLQGGGIGTIYLVTFAALKIYALIPHGAALAVFVVLAVATAFLAIVQDALALAVLGVLGGFLAPILASDNSGNFVALFTYYAVLNAGILGIAWFKDWRVLNLLGFTCTFLVGTAWGFKAYQPENYAWTQFFLALFFVFYATIAVFYAVKRPLAAASSGGAKNTSRGIIDGTLVFGLPAIAFALQVGLVKDTPWGLAISAIVVAAFYVAVASLVWKRSAEHGRSLAEAFLAIGVVFVTMAIPFALNASWTAAAYALEGAGLVWVGRRQGKPLAEAAGVLLQFAAGVTFDSPGSAELSQPVVDAIYPYAFLRAVGALASAYFLRTRVSAISSVAQGLLVVWAVGWLTGGTFYDIFDHDLKEYFAIITLSAITVHTLLLELIGRRLAWTAGRLGALLQGPQLAVGLVIWAVLELGLAQQQDWSWAGWLFALAVWMLVLKRQDQERYTKTLALAYGMTPLLVSAALAGIAYLHIDRHVPEGVWSAVAVGLIPAFVLFAFLAADVRDRWPMVTHRAAVINGFVPVVVYLLFWSLGGSFGSDGDPSPLPYVPLLTPLDLTQAFIILAGVAWALRVRVRYPERFHTLRVPLIAVLCFVLFAHLSAVCVRSCHYYAGIPWDWDDLMDATVVQTSLSIAWTVIALVVTALASRKKWRVVWMVGGALLGVVVLKLFIVDLSHIQTVARIISFLVVGLLLLLIGWISPVPPRVARA